MAEAVPQKDSDPKSVEEVDVKEVLQLIGHKDGVLSFPSGI